MRFLDVMVKSRRADFLRAAALAACVVVAWCIVQNRLTIRNWKVPLVVRGDALTLFAVEKAAAEGHFVPLLFKVNPHLGAPYAANWNDFPMTDEPLVLVGAALTRCVGLFTASNLLVPLAQLLAALSFYVVCRTLDCRWQWSVAGGLAFALSPFAFARGLGHLTLTYFWIIPLCLLVSWWCGSRQGLDLGSSRFRVAVVVALVTGVHNPYYSFVFLQFLGFAALAQGLRRAPWRRIAAPIAVGVACCGAFLAMNVDTIAYQAVRGPNTAALTRSYAALEIYALKPLDLLMPPPDHRLAVAGTVTQNYRSHEVKKQFVPGEGITSYLGLAGVASLLGLASVCVARTLGPMPGPLPAEALQILWLLLYSVVGGINGALGQAGLTLFRCSNRFSIYILALALLFGVRALSRLTASWRPGAATLGMLCAAALICWDQLPPRKTQASIDLIATTIESDRAFTAAMERALPPSAMVFQLPVMSFPESWPIEEMQDYEHLRPYLYSSDLHYSYGSVKGRQREAWQLAASRLPVPQLVVALEKIGFSAVYVNRKGYRDRGVALLSALRATTDTAVIESPAGDLAWILLHPAATAELPEQPPEFAVGWYDEESNAQGDVWRYSRGNAELVVWNDSARPQSRRLAFELASPSPRSVAIWSGGRLLHHSPVLGPARTAVILSLRLSPGATRLDFKTGEPVTFPGNPDQRRLGFLLYNLRVTSEPGSP